MDYEKIILDIKDNVAVLTLNHPEALNAISMQMNREIKDALDVVARTNSGARCLLITGAGRGFCAGANLMDSPRENTLGPREQYIDNWLSMFLQVGPCVIDILAPVPKISRHEE